MLVIRQSAKMLLRMFLLITVFIGIGVSLWLDEL